MTSIPIESHRYPPAARVTLFVIFAYWIGVAWWQLTWAHVPRSVGEILVRKLLEGAATLLVVWALSRFTGARISAMGFRLGWRDALVCGVVIPVALFVVTNIIVGSAVRSVFRLGRGPLIRHLFQGGVPTLLLWVVTAIIGGGVIEEFQRAYVLMSFDQQLGKGGVIFAVVVDTAVFALRHAYQGAFGIIGAALTGLAFALIYLRWRSVPAAMLAHAGYDLLGVFAAFAIYGGKP